MSYKKVVIEERLRIVEDHKSRDLTFDELCKVDSAIGDVKCRLIEDDELTEIEADKYIENYIEHIKELYVVDKLNPYDTITTIDYINNLNPRTKRLKQIT